MKKVLTFLLVFIFATTTLSLSATDQVSSNHEYEKNNSLASEPLGYNANTAVSTTISMSMVGWGLGLAAVIILITLLIHQSQATEGSSHS